MAKPTPPTTPSLFSAGTRTPTETVPIDVAIKDTPHGIPAELVAASEKALAAVAERATRTDDVPPADPVATPSSVDHPNSPPAEPPAQPPRAAMEDQPKPAPGSVVKRDPLPFYPSNTDEMWRYATMLANSDLLPRALKDKATGRGLVANIHFVLMKGHDFGLKPMTALASINVIDGKAEVGALLMVSLIRQSGLCKMWRLVESTDRRCIFTTQRVGDDEPTVFEYTIEEADQMGLLDKGKSDWAKENNQWKKQPRTMLRRRCQSSLAREVYPEVVLGMYDHDELSEEAEVAGRLGLRTDQVANAIPVTGAPALSAGVAGPIEVIAAAKDAAAAPIAVADPLKARLAERSGGGRIPRCSSCGSPRDPRDGDPCIACTVST